ncbi:MAG: SHOCT domain-containing protein, partial [Thermoplasmatota archaeon]
DAEKRGMNGLLWFILVILPMVGLLFLVLYLVIRESSTGRYENKSARKILDERYARGEISKEEYMDMKKNLN